MKNMHSGISMHHIPVSTYTVLLCSQICFLVIIIMDVRCSPKARSACSSSMLVHARCQLNYLLCFGAVTAVYICMIELVYEYNYDDVNHMTLNYENWCRVLEIFLVMLALCLMLFIPIMLKIINNAGIYIFSTSQPIPNAQHQGKVNLESGW